MKRIFDSCNLYIGPIRKSSRTPQDPNSNHNLLLGKRIGIFELFTIIK